MNVLLRAVDQNVLGVPKMRGGLRTAEQPVPDLKSGEARSPMTPTFSNASCGEGETSTRSSSH
jgi:hypothetical protein